jgi:Ca-activated chloride channel family protein
MTEMTTSAKEMQRQANSTVVYHWLAFVAVMAMPCIAWAQVTQLPPNKPGDVYAFQVSVNRVILNATVVDGHNMPVAGLSEGNFQIYEDGRLQQITSFSHEDIPVTVGILIDNSGSMKPKRNDVISAALAFARASNPQDQIFVVNFNDRVTFGLPANIPFTDRQDQLQQALSGITAIGQTSLYDGIIAGLNRLKQSDLERKALVLISDGGDNASSHTLNEVIGIARQSSAVIYPIGIFDDQDGDENPAVLRRLARESGGEAFFPESAKQATAICEEIARDIRNQYTLTYVPANPSQDGKYRAITVKARAPGRGRLSVRTRAGYSVPMKSPESSSAGVRP